MKIGIITFHWATNYGAILQAYALQTYLENLGHEVWIINYKPKHYELTYKKIFTNLYLLYDLKGSLQQIRKEKILDKFRKQKLNLTERYYSTEELQNNPPKFDIYISGSDQILNPSFTLNGDKKPSSAYYLNFGNDRIKRYGYAVSFGCVNYPINAKLLAEPLLQKFDFITVRENSGINILKSMNYFKTEVVPDPTLLIDSSEYTKLIEYDHNSGKTYNYVYILRNFIFRNELNKYVKNIKYADKNEYSVSKWLSNIKNAEFVVTNSYHGVIFCLHFEVPFIVVLETKENVGMNDRFYTLLQQLELVDRIISHEELVQIPTIKNKLINWLIVKDKIKSINLGIDLNKLISNRSII
jgi:hypothetical protein